MKSLILVSKKPVVIQIFTLVCKQLHIKLEVFHEAQIDHKVDIIVIDNDFIGERFNILKSYCKVIGAISKNDLSFDIANDFLIPMPFLPSTLYGILDKQTEIINKRAKSKVYISNIEVPDEEKQVLDEYNLPEEQFEDEFIIEDFSAPKKQKINDTKNAVDYLESLADDIAFDMQDEADDSIVSVSSVKQGGILDNKELSLLEDIINETASEQSSLEKAPKFHEKSNEDEWVDLSSIIDQAIDEVNMADTVVKNVSNDSSPIKVLINNYELDQLKPLLRLLDQQMIDKLSDGREVNLALKLDNGR